MENPHRVLALGKPDSGSYRDPSGQIHVVNGRVFRTVKERAREDYEFVRDTGLLGALQEREMIPVTTEVDKSQFADVAEDVAHILEHERLPWISFGAQGGGAFAP